MNTRLLFLFPDHARHRIDDALQGKIPRERLYGVLELRDRGWVVDISDARWDGLIGRYRRNLGRLFEMPSYQTIRDMSAADIVIAKDGFSTTLLFESRLARKPLIYLDAMFEPPIGARNRMSAYFNLKHADSICCYSKCQASDWSKSFGLPISRFEVLPYCIDTEFYPRLQRYSPEQPYVVAVGRDLGRDYHVLLEACDRLSLNLKLVTLPYLLPQGAIQNPRVEVLQNLDYAELFDLYAGALMSVVPLRSGINYPSGIRAILESAALGIPTVATKTDVLTEYLQPDEHIIYTRPEDVESLVRAMSLVQSDAESANSMANRASEVVRSTYSMVNFVDRFETVLEGIKY